MFDFMNEEMKSKNPKNSDSSDSDEDPLKQVALRLEKAANKVIAERNKYKQEVSQLRRQIKKLEEQINNNETIKKLEAKIQEEQKLQLNLEKRISALIEKLRDLLEEEDI